MINNVISTFLKKTREKGGKKGEKEEKEGKMGENGRRKKKGGKKMKKRKKKSLVRLQLWLQQAEQGLCLSTAVFEVEYYRDKSLFVRHSLK